MPQDHRFTLALVFGLSWGAVAIALALQHGFGMAPCAWCTVQRGVFLVIGLLALLALAAPWRPVRRLLALLGAAGGVAGCAAAGYQHFVAAKAGSCGFSWADRLIYDAQLDEYLPWLFKATASCGEANVPLLGIPFAAWSAALFVFLTAVLLVAALRRAPLSGRQ